MGAVLRGKMRYNKADKNAGIEPAVSEGGTMSAEALNILVTLDCNYLHQLNVMLTSLLEREEGFVRVFLLSRGEMTDEQLANTRLVLAGRGELCPITIREEQLQGAPTTDRYPLEIYYRIFAAKYLPQELDRVLYLDPDLVINQSIRHLYRLPMGTAFFAAASHIGNLLHIVNELRLDMDETSPYINSGVMLMNLRQLRQEQDYAQVFDYIEAHKNRLILPDQDIISGLYGGRIIPLDAWRYNMTERLVAFHRQAGERMDLDFVRENCAIIHYCGRNKPWKSNYIGKLDCFYKEAEAKYLAMVKAAEK